MPERDWNKLNTIEFKGSKGWEIISFHDNFSDAVIEFRDRVINEAGQWRLTTAA